MKKLVLFAAIAFAASMVSCGGNTENKDAEQQGTEVIEAVEEQVEVPTEEAQAPTEGEEAPAEGEQAPAEGEQAPAETPAN